MNNIENCLQTLWAKDFPLKRQYICKQMGIILPVASKNFNSNGAISVKFQEKLKTFILSHQNYFTENQIVMWFGEK